VSFCQAFQKGKIDELPLRIKQQTKKVIKKSVIILEYQGTYAVKKRDQSLLQHLYEPYVLSHPTSLNDLSTLFEVSVHQIEDRGIFLHAFSHLIWHMQVYVVHLLQPQNLSGYIFASKQEIQTKYPIATAYYKWLKPMLGI
jgi:A/G-specific adenine glycosylase